MVERVVDRRGEIMEENQPEKSKVLSPQTSYIMTNLLMGVVENGTGRRVKTLGRPIAGKTGTTDEYNDAWFIGYTPDLIAGSWVGFDQLRSLGRRETGARAAAPIFIKFMREAISGTPIRTFSAPRGIVFAKIDPVTGYLADGDTNGSILECFREGNLPPHKEKKKVSQEDFFILDSLGEDSLNSLKELYKRPQDEAEVE
jgi:penicillin-binding protein 1A